jgi:hypothetical protein
LLSAAGPAAAITPGVVVPVISMSTLVSLRNLATFFAVAVGSDASSSTIQLIFSPAMLVGNNWAVFFCGPPSTAAGPVADTLTPMLMSASAAVAPNRDRAITSGLMDSLTFMFSPRFCV